MDWVLTLKNCIIILDKYVNNILSKGIGEEWAASWTN